MRMAVEKGRQTKPDLLIGICGEHGGEPSSIEFCHLLSLEYVSCSPYRIPVARLAAARRRLSIKDEINKAQMKFPKPHILRDRRQKRIGTRVLTLNN